MTSDPGEESADPRRRWVRSLNVLLWYVTVNSGSSREFVTLQSRVEGVTAKRVYSKRLWLFLNVASIVLVAVAVVLTLMLALVVTFGLIMVIGLLVLLLLVVYTTLFVWITFVPP